MAYSCADRVVATLRGEVPDRVPIFEYLIHEGVFEKAGYPNIAVHDVHTYFKACSKYLDLCHPTLYAPFEPGERINEDGSKTVIERWMSWHVPLPVDQDDEALRLKNMKERIEKLEANEPEDFLKNVLEEKKGFAPYLGEMVYINCGGSPVLPYDNTEASIYFYLDNTELVDYWMKLENRRTLEYVQAIAYPHVCPIGMSWADITYNGGLFYPPDVLERTFYPVQAEICDIFHSRNMPVIYHADGDLTDALPRLVECGINGLNPFEISGKMNITEFKEVYGKKLTMVGGMDAVNHLAFGTVDEVVAATKRLIDIVGKDGGLIAASSSGQVDDSMPTENVMAFYETCWEYGKYK